MNYYIRKLLFTLRRDKRFGILNVFGLAIGLACSLLVFLWVEDELTYDHYFKNRNHLYKVMQNMTNSGKTFVFSSSPPILAEHIQEEIPEVTNVVRFNSAEEVMSLDDKQIREKGFYCDSSFFSIFNVQFLKGAPEYAFNDVNSIVLSGKTAERFFQKENPVGKTLLINNKPYKVTSVVKDFPENVSIRFDWLMPFQVWQANNSWANNNWTGNAVNTVIEIHHSADIQVVNKKLVEMLVSRRGNDNLGAFLYKMNDWHIYSDFDDRGLPVGGILKLIRLFIFIALIITIIACINFMNLATAGAMKRAKEVGILKAIGVKRSTLIWRFLNESMTQVFFSLVLSIVIVLCFLPVFNQLIAKNLSFNFLSTTHIFVFIAIFLFCGLLSGVYPAFFLSSFKVIDVLKGLKLPSPKGVNKMRQLLVLFQLSASICLIVCILVMYGQFMHTSNRDWGYQTEGVVSIPLNGNAANYSNVLLQEIRSLATVESAGISGNVLSIQYKMGANNFNWGEKNAGLEMPVCIADCITGIFSSLRIELESGRDFNENAGNEAGNVIINQRMAALMGEEGRLEGEITFQNKNYRIIGITKDHIFNDYKAIHSEPLIFFCGLNQNRNYHLYVKLKDKADIRSTLQPIETFVKSHKEGYFEYNILADTRKYMIKNELFIAKLLTGFSVVSVIITCFGLLCMIAFATERRIKEIGIRKVFGASILQVLSLFGKDYLILTGISCCIAFPLSWWFMYHWLNNFEYRMPLYWWIFASAGISVFVITMCTVGIQAFKAAITNPVSAIKTE